MSKVTTCRMTLHSGERCQYPARTNGLCGVHRRGLEKRKKTIDNLIRFGALAEALRLLYEIAEAAAPYVVEFVKTVLISGAYSKGSRAVPQPRRSVFLPPAQHKERRHRRGYSFKTRRLADQIDAYREEATYTKKNVHRFKTELFRQLGV